MGNATGDQLTEHSRPLSTQVMGPLYLMRESRSHERMKFVRFSEAAVIYREGLQHGSFGGLVLLSDLSVRAMTDHEMIEISRTAMK